MPFYCTLFDTLCTPMFVFVWFGSKRALPCLTPDPPLSLQTPLVMAPKKAGKRAATVSPLAGPPADATPKRMTKKVKPTSALDAPLPKSSPSHSPGPSQALTAALPESSPLHSPGPSPTPSPTRSPTQWKKETLKAKGPCHTLADAWSMATTWHKCKEPCNLKLTQLETAVASLDCPWMLARSHSDGYTSIFESTGVFLPTEEYTPAHLTMLAWEPLLKHLEATQSRGRGKPRAPLDLDRSLKLLGPPLSTAFQCDVLEETDSETLATWISWFLLEILDAEVSQSDLKGALALASPPGCSLTTKLLALFHPCSQRH